MKKSPKAKSVRHLDWGGGKIDEKCKFELLSQILRRKVISAGAKEYLQNSHFLDSK